MWSPVRGRLKVRDRSLVEHEEVGSIYNVKVVHIKKVFFTRSE